jgi:hypothetical protein
MLQQNTAYNAHLLKLIFLIKHFGRQAMVSLSFELERNRMKIEDGLWAETKPKLF